MSNRNKAVKGNNVKTSIQKILEELEDKSCISELEKKFTRQIPDSYSIYANYRFKVANGEIWAIYASSSCRSDRVKENHWDSFLIKKFNFADKCFLIFLSEVSDIDKKYIDNEAKKIASIQSSQYAENELDGVMYDIDMYNKISHIAINNLPHGHKGDKQGVNFEERLVSILNYEDNLKVWTNSDPLATGNQYIIFTQILFKLNVGTDIKNICATNKIPKLPSGGNPKTDIAITVTYNDNTQEIFTISCKSSNENQVSGHEYSADKFIEVLNITDQRTQELLKVFQQAGAVKYMNPNEADELKQKIQPYVDALTKWVLSGNASDCNIPEIQCAQYIYSYDSERCIGSIYSIEQYSNMLKTSVTDAASHFGTPFSWTYPSKKRGKKIQLKMPTFKRNKTIE